MQALGKKKEAKTWKDRTNQAGPRLLIYGGNGCCWIPEEPFLPIIVIVGGFCLCYHMSTLNL
jgi:hypothetical protein